MHPEPPEKPSCRRLLLPAYGPTVLVSIGYGAVVPLVALSARALGASVGTAALIVALPGIGQLLGDLPAGNGISAGIVMTLGADASPDEARAQFLGGWRLCSDVGNSAGSLVVSAVSAVAPLAVAALAMAMGTITLLGTGWLAHWVPAYAPVRLRDAGSVGGGP